MQATFDPQVPHPSFTTKHREHDKYFNKQLEEWWQHVKLQELISQCEATESRLNKSVKNKNLLDYRI